MLVALHKKVMMLYEKTYLQYHQFITTVQHMIIQYFFHSFEKKKKGVLIFVRQITSQYIYCHPQTGCFVVSQLFNVARSCDRNRPNFTFDLISDRSVNKRTTLAKVLCSKSSTLQQQPFVYILYLTGYQSAQFVQRALHYACGSWKSLMRLFKRRYWRRVLAFSKLDISWNFSFLMQDSM